MLLQKISINFERFFTAYWWLQFKVLWTFSIFVYFIINFDSWCKYAKHISLKSLNSTKKETKKRRKRERNFRFMCALQHYRSLFLLLLFYESKFIVLIIFITFRFFVRAINEPNQTQLSLRFHSRYLLLARSLWNGTLARSGKEKFIFSILKRSKSCVIKSRNDKMNERSWLTNYLLQN